MFVALVFIALAFGVAPPSLSAAPFAFPATAPFAGEDWKNRGDCDCVESACSLEPPGVASSPREEACEASVWSWFSAPGLEGIVVFRVALRGVAEAEERCVRLFVGDDILRCNALKKALAMFVQKKGVEVGYCDA